MLGAGGLRGAAKRTAFGDVSNTAKNISNVQDDLVTVGKSALYEPLQKPGQVLDKPAAFLRPAQRPLTVAGLKGLLGNNNNNSSITASAIQPLADVQQTSQVVKPRTLSKRATTIYKDTAPTTDQAPVESAIQNAAPIPPVHQTLGPRQHRSQPQLKANQPILRRTQSKVIGHAVEEPAQVPLPPESTEEQVIDEQVTDEQVNGTIEELRELNTSAVTAPEQPEERLAVQITEDKHKLYHELPALPLVSEPEEYWEEEEEEEIYDEQGYTTAHSYRSRGENTTGGATTVLFPKVTSKVKKELAAAKDLVESARTIEEMEDEQWDTSMVAEYGEEIFKYMRELEVRCFYWPRA